MTNYTPGPLWMSPSTPKLAAGIHTADGACIGTAHRDEDARLWASAPALLEALEVALNTVECASIDVQTGADLPWYTLAKKAIAKAEGREVAS